MLTKNLMVSAYKLANMFIQTPKMNGSTKIYIKQIAI